MERDASQAGSSAHTGSASSSVEASVIIPLGSRYEDLDRICGGLRRILAPLVQGYEVIIVDDATEANTRQLVRVVADRHPEVRLIRLQRRMGEATALAVGARSARGRTLITLDPYLHVALDELPNLLKPLADGADLVCARRFPRQERGMSRIASDAFNTAARWLTNTPVHDLNCRVRVLRREVIQDMPLYGDLHRFLPIFASRRGYRWCEVSVPQSRGKRELDAFHARAYLDRLLDLLTLVFLTRFVKRPLHFFGLIGAAGLAAGVALCLHLAYVKLVAGEGIGHRPLLLLGVLLLVVGIQIASIGLLGELMIFTHARDIKDYVVTEPPDEH